MIIDNRSQQNKVKKRHIEDFSCLQEIDSKSKVNSILMKNNKGMCMSFTGINSYLVSSWTIDDVLKWLEAIQLEDLI